MNIEDKINEDVIFTDFKPLIITKELKEEILKNPERYYNLSPRIALGMFYTEEEYHEYINNSLNRKLPGDEEENIRIRKNK